MQVNPAVHWPALHGLAQTKFVPSSETHSFDRQSLGHAQAVPSLNVATPAHVVAVVLVIVLEPVLPPEEPAEPELDDPDDPDDAPEAAKIEVTVAPVAHDGSGYVGFAADWACFAVAMRRAAQASKRV